MTKKCRTKDDAKWCIFPYMDGAKGKIKVKTLDANCPTAVAGDGTITQKAAYDEDKCPFHAKKGRICQYCYLPY